MFAILSERGVRTIARWPECREQDRRDQNESADAEENLYRWRIAQFAATGRLREPSAVLHICGAPARVEPLLKAAAGNSCSPSRPRPWFCLQIAGAAGPKSK